MLDPAPESELPRAQWLPDKALADGAKVSFSSVHSPSKYLYKKYARDVPDVHYYNDIGRDWTVLCKGTYKYNGGVVDSHTMICG